ncbi:substrate-binding domain-containing protein [Streptomyces sp. NPDC058206]|uniref:substrate-binding domain-containing protein n=1 Tax=Streptomyces sp. NPDC058206 TaxID=3346382 RepID=UPI0036E2FF1F
MRDTLTYLTALGHRSVARVAGLPDLIHTQLRDRARREICFELGLGEPVIVHTDYSGDDGAHATRRLISSVARPTAVIYDNDIMAVAGLSVAQEMGLDAPGDLSLVAWDDSQLSRVVRPPLTALSRDIPAYGSHAARTLMALVTEGSAAGFEDSAARLVPRGSTAPPR